MGTPENCPHWKMRSTDPANKLKITWSPTGSAFASVREIAGTSINTYGSRMFYGNSQFSGPYAVGNAATRYSVSGTGGGFAAYSAFLNVAGIKTAANDVTAAFAGQVNAGADQTTGDIMGATLYARNSAQALSGGTFGILSGYAYMGATSATKTFRGAWFDVLEQATTPNASRDWIVFGAQLTAGALAVGGGNITGFYFNSLSTDLETRLTTKGMWLRGSMKIGIDLSGVTIVREANPANQYGAAQIVLANISNRPVSIFTYAGDPTDEATVGEHAASALCIDTTNKRLYMNVGDHTTPDWDYVTNWT